MSPTGERLLVWWDCSSEAQHVSVSRYSVRVINRDADLPMNAPQACGGEPAIQEVRAGVAQN